MIPEILSNQECPLVFSQLPPRPHPNLVDLGLVYQLHMLSPSLFVPRDGELQRSVWIPRAAALEGPVCDVPHQTQPSDRLSG